MGLLLVGLGSLMPTVDVDDKVDLERLLDEDVPCANPKCDESASWAMKNHCCGLQIQVCGRCFIRLMRKLKFAERSKRALHCARCAMHITASEMSWWPL